MSWRAARSITTLLAELDVKFPSRTKPDWIVGDAAHQNRTSDHNPNAAGVVCAVDIRAGGIDLAAVAEHLRRTNHPAVKYVIHNRRIWSKARNSEGWRTYTGANPHTDHIHVSVGTGPDGRSTGPYDSTASWGIANLAGGGSSSYETYRKGVKAGSRTVGQFKSGWSAGDDVKELQRILNAWYPKRASLVLDGYFGPATHAAVRHFQTAAKITVDGYVGPQSWRTLGVIK